MAAESTIFGVVAGASGALADILWEWVFLQDRVGRSMDWNDVPWWYGERTCLGLFAGAAWRSGGLVMQEHSVARRHLKRFKLGRGDLYLQHHGREFVLEAKAAYVPLDRPEDNGALTRALKNARADAKAVKVHYGEIKLACVFAIPWISGATVKSCDELIRSWAQKFVRISNGGRAWVFPGNARRMINSDDGRVYPGVAIILERIA